MSLHTALLPDLLAAAQAPGSQPAGGAAVREIAIATAAASIVTTVLLVLGLGHRTGRLQVLAKLAAFSERVSGLPGWAALPSGIATGSLITAVFGMYWDIALHIGVGRDEGPLANPAHYFILAGLFGIFAAGFLAMVLPTGRPSPTAIRLTRTWHAPLGGVLVAACGAFSLIGFPLDDVWHRMFGQDVTLWGPTHLMLIGGASMTLVGMAVLIVEGKRAQGGELRWAAFARSVALPGGFMLGLSTFQAEFDFGVPQFRFVFQPVLIMLAAGVGLVVARMYGGRGAALGAVAFFLVVRGVLAVIVGPVFGEPTPHLPLYVVEALIVEAVAFKIASTERPLAFGLTSGALIGTVGLAAEWGWSHVGMPLPWPSNLLPEAALLGLATAVAAGALGGWIGTRLSIDARPRIPALRVAALASAAVIGAVVVYALQKPTDEGLRADVVLTDVRTGPERTVQAQIIVDPDVAEDAEWLQVTAWQGDGLVLDRLRRTGPGRYETTRPIPVHGNWKALIRLHRGDSLTVAPLFLPRDTAIPAPEVPAPARFSRAFVPDHEVLQREQKDAAGALTVLAYAVVAGIALGLLALLAWGLHRLGVAGRGGPTPPASASRSSAARELAPGGATRPAVPAA